MKIERYKQKKGYFQNVSWFKFFRLHVLIMCIDIVWTTVLCKIPDTRFSGEILNFVSQNGVQSLLLCYFDPSCGYIYRKYLRKLWIM